MQDGVLPRLYSNPSKMLVVTNLPGELTVKVEIAIGINFTVHN